LKPLRPSADPDAVIVTEDAGCHDDEPPETAGMDGAAVSIFTVLAAPLAAGAHPDETFPALSVARICTSVVPSAEIVAGAGIAADHVVPPSVDVRY
jgi:hypothetical protein